MRKPFFLPAVITLLVVLAAGVFWWSHDPGPSSTDKSARAIPAATPRAAEPMPAPTPARDQAAIPTRPANAPPGGDTAASLAPSRAAAVGAAPAPGAGSLPPPTVAPTSSPGNPAGMVELEKTRRMIHDYHTLMGENPVGTNTEIMKALMGGNSHQATLGPLEGQQLNGRGELVDPWGTPYFFHQLSGDVMEVHSAGPDKIMGTADDLVTR